MKSEDPSAAELGMASFDHSLPESTIEEELLQLIASLNRHRGQRHPGSAATAQAHPPRARAAGGQSRQRRRWLPSHSASRGQKRRRASKRLAVAVLKGIAGHYAFPDQRMFLPLASATAAPNLHTPTSASSTTSAEPPLTPGCLHRVQRLSRLEAATAHPCPPPEGSRSYHHEAIQDPVDIPRAQPPQLPSPRLRRRLPLRMDYGHGRACWFPHGRG